MRRFFLSLLPCLILITAFLPAQEGTWIQKAEFPSSSRNHGLGFTVGTKGYYGLGDKQTKLFVFKSYTDIWEYDPKTNVWTQKADFPGPARLAIRGFSVDNKIYAGFGYIISAYGPTAGSNEYQTDFYEFDPATNQWSKKNNAYLGRGDIFFSNKGRIYCVNPEYRTLNKYNPSTDTWFESKWEKNLIAPDPDNISGSDICFSLGEKEYFVTAAGKKDKFINPLWELNPNAVTWLKKNDLPPPGSDTISIFTSGEKVYAMRDGKEILEYDSASDIWLGKKEIPSEHKDFQPVFSLGGKFYGFSKYKFWEFNPH